MKEVIVIGGMNFIRYRHARLSKKPKYEPRFTMTDRIKSITVALEKDIREDDIKPLLTAIRQMRGVLSVATNVADSDSWLAEERASAEWRKKILQVIFPDRKLD